MNRRKAIGRLILVGLGGAIGFGGYRWHALVREPDITFLEKQDALLGALADTIIPSSANAPGALQAGVGPFILAMVKDCADRKTQNKFVDGLIDLETRCQRSFNRSYLLCDKDQQQEVLSFYAKKESAMKGWWGKAEARLLGMPFFDTLKRYTVMGYCSSQKGATQGLAYLAVPGSYQGCIAYQKDQPAWATK